MSFGSMQDVYNYDPFSDYRYVVAWLSRCLEDRAHITKAIDKFVGGLEKTVLAKTVNDWMAAVTARRQLELIAMQNQAYYDEMFAADDADSGDADEEMTASDWERAFDEVHNS